ncbi:MAG: FHA domain-containing protein [Verrucomicrobiota bacterium]|jgi:pSer/pThr/pTyr-binding forkhead associated (FHA) protein
MPRLVVIKAAEAGKTFEIDAPELVIGRQAGAHILIDGPKVSRRHARVIRDGDGVRLEDLDSINGTFLNGKRLESPATLKGKDEVGIGSYLLRYEDADRSPEVNDLLAQVLAHLFVLFPHAERGLAIFLEDGRPSVRA